VTAGPGWFNYPDGTPVYDGTVVAKLWQQNRLLYLDNFFTLKYAYGPIRLWTKTKVSGNLGAFWQLDQIDWRSQQLTPPSTFVQ